MRALMDDVPPDLNRRLTHRILDLPGVVPDSARVRTRFVGEQPHVEVTLSTPRGRSIEEAHQLMADVQQAVRTELHKADVLVHIEPARLPAEPYATTVYSIAQQIGLRVHNLDLYQLADCVRVEVDLELPGDMTLAEAHTHSERLEAAITSELSGCTVVAVHLEPRRDDVQPAVRYTPITQQVAQIVQTLPEANRIAHVEALLTDIGIIVTLRCNFPGTLALTEVHSAMAQIENELYRALPDIARVQIDPEPAAYLEPTSRHPTPDTRRTDVDIAATA
ncbi:MAG: hypothetical protein HC876_10185 [Chloroflexaceae bacterium]|nr:hypothetical protein [Chloroflexaceae bacterium]